MLQNAYFLAKIGADTAENEQHFAEMLPKIGNYPTDSGCNRADLPSARLHGFDVSVLERRVEFVGFRDGRPGLGRPSHQLSYLPDDSPKPFALLRTEDAYNRI